MRQASYANADTRLRGVQGRGFREAEVIEKLKTRIAELVDQDRLIAELRCEVAELKGQLTQLRRLLGRYPARHDRIVTAGFAANPFFDPAPGKKRPKAANLLECLNSYRGEVPHFGTNVATDFDYN